MKHSRTLGSKIFQAITSRFLPEAFGRQHQARLLQEKEIEHRNLEHDQQQKKILKDFLRDIK